MRYYFTKFDIHRQGTTEAVVASNPHEGLKSFTLNKGEVITYCGVHSCSCIPNICWWSEYMMTYYPTRDHVLVYFE